MRLVGGAVLDALLPPQCVLCDAPVTAGGGFCRPCFAAVHVISPPCCTCCGVPFGHAGQAGRDSVCPRCLEHPPPWRCARAALQYDVHSRRIILALKHGDRTELAAPLGAMMARAGAALLAEAEIIVPVPLHPQRLRARRYNQAALLARAVGRIGGVSVGVDILVRTRATSPLGELSAEQREVMVAGAFGVRLGSGVRIHGRRVLLVDDVLTSGATARGCVQALIGAGAARVDVLAAARVPDPRLS